MENVTSFSEGIDVLRENFHDCYSYHQMGTYVMTTKTITDMLAITTPMVGTLEPLYSVIDYYQEAVDNVYDTVVTNAQGNSTTIQRGI